MVLQDAQTTNRVILTIVKQFSIILLFMAVISYPVIAGYASPCPDLNIKVKDHLISMDIKEQPLNCVIGQLSRQTGIRIKLWHDINKPLTLNLNHIPIEDFFHKLGAGNALVYTWLPEKKEYRLIAANMAKSTSPSPRKKMNGKDKSSIETDMDNTVRPGELLVKFKAHVSKNQIDRLHHFLGSSILKQIDPLRLYRVKIDPQLSMDKAIQMYLATGLVLTAERHGVRTLHQHIPNDTGFPQQWGLTAIKAPDGWEISRGSEDVIIAVIDTGVDYRHPDLQKNIWINPAEAGGKAGVDDDKNGYVDDIYGWDFAENNNQPLDMDGHGTHIAGTIGAVTDNSTGISGVCSKVKLMVLKVQGDEGYDMDTFDIIEAVEYAKKQGAHIINCSFGGKVFQDSEVTAFEQFQNANNGLMICSAGNESTNIDITPLYPACYDLPGIICVAASTKTSSNEYSLAGFSNFGAAGADVMAPGDDILSTTPETAVTQAYLKIGTDLTTYPAEGFSFAALTDINGITGSLVDCGYGYPDEIPGDVKNNIALIKRGNRDGTPFYFSQKTTNVQQMGALGAVIHNNEPGDFSGTLETQEDWITVISIARETGILLKENLPTAVTLVNTPYGQMSGTSMATGFVSGAAGLLGARAPEETFTRLKEILFDTVDIIDSTEGKILTKGQINLFNALAELPLKGDVNKDFKLTIEDSILGLKIMSGSTSDAISQDSPHWDLNNDGKPGLPESLHVLQQKSY